MKAVNIVVLGFICFVSLTACDMGTPAPSQNQKSSYVQPEEVKVLTVFLVDGSHTFVVVKRYANKAVANVNGKLVTIKDGSPAEIAIQLFGKSAKSARWANN